MEFARAFLLALLCAAAWGQAPPAQPSELERRLKAAYIGYLGARAPASAAAREVSRFYAAHPEADVRFPGPDEFARLYAGPATPPLEQIRAFYDPRLELIVVPRTGELEGLDGELPGGAALEALLRVRAHDILHESFHALLDKKFGFKVINIMDGEVLANWKEAQFLAAVGEPGAALAAAAGRHLRIEELGRAGPGKELSALESAEAADAEKLGPEALDNAVKVARFKRGAAVFKKGIAALYGGAGQGMPSVFDDRGQVEAALRRELERPGLRSQEREVLLVELSLWSRPDRVAALRRYFRQAAPELFN